MVTYLKLVTQTDRDKYMCLLWLIKAKFHYASWFGAGSELKFGLSSSLLAAN